MVISEKEKTKAEKGAWGQGWGSKQVTLLYIVMREGLTINEIIFDITTEQRLEEREVMDEL